MLTSRPPGFSDVRSGTWIFHPNGPLGNVCMPQYFRGTFQSCMGIMPMRFTLQGLLVWTQQDTTISLDNRGVLLAGVRHTMVAPTAHFQ
jgi:hypothetical protein